MARSARNAPKSQSPKVAHVVIENEILIRRLAVMSGTDAPVRTLIKVEVGDLEPEACRQVIQSIGSKYSGNHPTFICPVRNGLPTTDVVFEKEILEFVRTFCEVKDGQIVLQGPPPIPVDKAEFNV